MPVNLVSGLTYVCLIRLSTSGRMILLINQGWTMGSQNREGSELVAPALPDRWDIDAPSF